MNRITKLKLLLRKKSKSSSIAVMLKILQLHNQAIFHRNLAKTYQNKANKIMELLSVEFITTRSIGAKKRFSFFYEKQIPLMDDEEFKLNFRVSRKTFSFLVENLISLRKKITRYKVPISLEKRVAIALYTLGN